MPQTNLTYSDRVYAPTCAVTATWTDSSNPKLLPADLPGPFVYRVVQRNDPSSDVLYRIAILTDFAGVSTSRTNALRGLKGLPSVVDVTPTDDLTGSPFYFSRTVRLTAASLPALMDLVAALEQRVENLIASYTAYTDSLDALGTTNFPLEDAAIVAALTDAYLAAATAKTNADAAVTTATADLAQKDALSAAAEARVSVLDGALAQWAVMDAATAPARFAYAGLVSAATTAVGSLPAGSALNTLNAQLNTCSINSATVITAAELALKTYLEGQKTAATLAATTAAGEVATAETALTTAQRNQKAAAENLTAAQAALEAVCPDYPFP